MEKPKEIALIFVVSGPAGSGKTTLCDRMLKELSPKVQRVITATTRIPRIGEVNGEDYYFLSQETFEKKIQNEEFYEYAKVHANYYGILKDEIIQKLSKHIDLLVNIDVQGAETLRKAAGKDAKLAGRIITIFIMPESTDELRNRLYQRGQNEYADIAKRLEVAKNEVQEWKYYDYCISSRTKDEDFACLLSIYRAEKLRVIK